MNGGEGGDEARRSPGHLRIASKVSAGHRAPARAKGERASSRIDSREIRVWIRKVNGKPNAGDLSCLGLRPVRREGLDVADVFGQACVAKHLTDGLDLADVVPVVVGQAAHR